MPHCWSTPSGNGPEAPSSPSHEEARNPHWPQSPLGFLEVLPILVQALKTKAGSDPWQWSEEHPPASLRDTSRPGFATTEHWPPNPVPLASPKSSLRVGPCWAQILDRVGPRLSSGADDPHRGLQGAGRRGRSHQTESLK